MVTWLCKHALLVLCDKFLGNGGFINKFLGVTHAMRLEKS